MAFPSIHERHLALGPLAARCLCTLELQAHPFPLHLCGKTSLDGTIVPETGECIAEVSKLQPAGM